MILVHVSIGPIKEHAEAGGVGGPLPAAELARERGREAVDARTLLAPAVAQRTEARDRDAKREEGLDVTAAVAAVAASEWLLPSAVAGA